MSYIVDPRVVIPEALNRFFSAQFYAGVAFGGGIGALIGTAVVLSR